MAFGFPPERWCASGGIMRDEELRFKAEQCLLRASAASDEGTQILFLNMAEAWLRLASHKERIAAVVVTAARDAALTPHNGREQNSVPLARAHIPLRKGPRPA